MGARGIQVLCQPQITSVDDIFESRAERFDLILLARPGNFPHLNSLRRLAPKTPVVYFTHDLHHLRTQRTAGNITDRKMRRRLLQLPCAVLAMPPRAAAARDECWRNAASTQMPHGQMVDPGSRSTRLLSLTRYSRS